MTLMLEMARIRDAIFFFPLHAAAAVSKWWKKSGVDYREQVAEEKRRESLGICVRCGDEEALHSTRCASCQTVM
jgi:ribosomal protein L40E